VQTVFQPVAKLACLLLLAAFCTPALGTEPVSSLKNYQNLVRPLIQKHCIQCHGANKPKGKFRIDILGVNLHEGESAGVGE